MKRKTLLCLTVVLALSLIAVVFVACQDNQTANYNVTIDKPYISLYVGYKEGLTAQVEGNADDLQTVWTSDDETVASVDSVTGVVTALSEGITTIKATVGEKSAVCVVVVKLKQTETPTDVFVESIYLNKSSIELKPNETFTLSATVVPANATIQTVTWESMDTSVATVDENGKVTAVGEGVTMVLASAGNRHASCNIKIANQPSETKGEISFKTLQANGDKLRTVVPNSTAVFDFNNEVEIINGNWDVNYDAECKMPIEEYGLANLKVGDNVFYLFVKIKGEVSHIYTVTIRRLAICEVTFDTVGAAEIAPLLVEEGTEIELTTPSKTGYEFRWWIDDNDNKRINTYTVYNDVTLTARFTPIQYIVELNANGGIVSPSSVRVSYDSTYKLGVPVYSGHIFVGWYIGDTPYTDNQGNSLDVWKFTIGKTFVARWTDTQYSVTLNVEGCDQNVTTQGYGIYNYGDNVTVSVSVTPLGYEFLGWYDGVSLASTNAQYQFAMPAYDITLTAKFDVLADVANLDFTSTDTTFVIHGFKEGADTSDLVIPSFTTDIDEYAFGSFYEDTSVIQNVYWRANSLPREGKPIFVFTIIRNLYVDSGVTYFPSLTFSDDQGVENLYYQGTLSQWCNIDFEDDSPLLGALDNANWFVNNRLITSVIVPTDVTVLKDFVFSGARITSVILHDGITEIGDGVFRYCSALKFINLPYSLTRIGAHAFLGDENLTGRLAIPNGVTQIGNLAFFETRFTSVVIPASVNALGNNLFDGVTTENETVSEIYYCGTLEQWNAISIGSPNRALTKATKYYYSESEPALNNDGTGYDNNYWHYVDNKIVVWKINSSLITVVKNIDDDNAIGKTTVYELGDEVTLTADIRLGYDFLGWYSGEQLLTDQFTYSFTATERNATYVEKWRTDELAQGLTFESTATTFMVTGAIDLSVTEITIPHYATHIKSYAFAYSYQSLQHVTFLSGISSIGGGAFARCESLTKVEIDSLDNWLNISFSDIHSNPLYYARDLYINGEKLTNLVIPENVAKIKPYAFANSSITSVQFSDSVTSIGQQAFDSSDISGELVIPDSVTEIGSIAFYACNSITDLTIGRGVTSLLSQFINCHNLVNVTILEGVKELGYGAFINSWSLQNVTLPSSLQKIGDSAFLRCYALTNINLPNGLKEIGSDAFRQCSSLQSVVIPSSVQVIEEGAFLNLTIDLYYSGTAEQWAQIEIGNLAAARATVYFYSASEPALNGDGTDYDGNYWRYVDNAIVVWTKGQHAVRLIVEGCDQNVAAIGAGGYYVDDNVTVSVSSTPLGYEFLGWDNGVELLSTELTYNFAMPARNVALTAKFQIDERIANFVFTSSDSWFYIRAVKDTSVTEITIPEYVRHISTGAFDLCENLQNVNWLAKNCVSAGYWAKPLFANSNIVNVTIGSQVTFIPEYTFYCCSDIENTYYDGDIASWCAITFENESSNPLYYSKNLYLQGELTREIDIPSDIQINAYALGNISLDSVNFLGSLEDWCAKQFGRYSNPASNAQSFCIDGEVLQEVVIPQTVTSVADYAFYGVQSITKVTLHDNVTSIGAYAFDGCVNLSQISFGSGIRSIKYYAFHECKGLNRVDVTDLLTWLSIDFNGFYANPLDDYFSNRYLYVGGDKLTDLVVPDGIEEIKAHAFTCSNIASAQLPDSVKYIGERAFYGCKQLTSCNLPQGLISIGKQAFRSSKLTGELVIPDSVTEIGSGAFVSCSGITGINLGSGLTIVASNVFGNCSGLVNVTVPEGITEIEEYAFMNCANLEHVTLPTTLQKLGRNAFMRCIKLTQVTIPSSVEVIGEGAFRSCTQLASVEIGNGVKEIGNAAFVGAIFTDIVIPASIQKIGYNAFNSTILETIYYQGSAEQWSQIEINENNIAFFNAIVYFYSESELELNDDGTDYDGNYWHYVDSEIVMWTKENND